MSLDIDEHIFRHQDLIYTVTEVKQRKMLGVLRDDQIATLKAFLKKIPPGKVREIYIDMKESLRKVSEEIFPEAKVLVYHFHVIVDSNRRMEEARKIFLMGYEKLNEVQISKIAGLLMRYPSLKAFYWTKEKIRKLYR